MIFALEDGAEKGFFRNDRIGVFPRRETHFGEMFGDFAIGASFGQHQVHDLYVFILIARL